MSIDGIRERAKTTNAFARWVPTSKMIADSFTKDDGDAIGHRSLESMHEARHVSNIRRS